MQTSNNHIIILTGPVRSGKTTALQQLVAGRKNVSGFLTPDVEGKRMLHIIATGKNFEFEVDDASLQHTVSIGRFHFSEGAFQEAKKTFAIAGLPQLFIIDEIGKLEVQQHAGLEPELCEFIKRFTQCKVAGTILLVIRDTLLQQAIQKYGIENPIIVDSNIEDASVALQKLLLY